MVLVIAGGEERALREPLDCFAEAPADLGGRLESSAMFFPRLRLPLRFVAGLGIRRCSTLAADTAPDILTHDAPADPSTARVIQLAAFATFPTHLLCYIRASAPARLPVRLESLHTSPSNSLADTTTRVADWLDLLEPPVGARLSTVA